MKYVECIRFVCKLQLKRKQIIRNEFSSDGENQ